MIKSESKDILYNITQIFSSNKCCSFDSPKNHEKYNGACFTQKYEAAQIISTLIIIRNVS